MESWQQEQIHALLRVESDADLYALLAQAGTSMGFEYCAYGMRFPLPVTRPRVLVYSNYPKAWQQRYLDADYIKVDPTVQHGLRSISPYIWTGHANADCPAFWEDVYAHGLGAGCAQACHDPMGVGSLLNMVCIDAKTPKADLEAVTPRVAWLTHVAHQALSRLVVSSYMPELQVQLTSRELDVLRWTADGKTSGAVGDIMHISERTVNFHMVNVLRKLGVENKTAAAIKAAVLGLL